MFKFLKKNKKEYIIPIFVPHLGCKYKCTFCDQRTISGEENKVSAKDVKEIIEFYLKNFKEKDTKVEVAFFGGSFTAIDEKKQNELLEAVEPFIKEGKVNSIRCSTRPDAISKDVLKRLKKYNVKTIELGVQSTNDYILKKCGRGHSFEDVKKASKLIRRNGFILGHQIMVGLSESTAKDDLQTAKDSCFLKPQIVRIYPVLVIKNTILEKEYRKKDYIPLTINQAVERSVDIVKLYRKKQIEVIRIGLQNTDTISEIGEEKSDVIAGPYHPAFGQLVEDRIWYEKIEESIKNINSKVKRVEIKVNEEDINNVVGHKKENIEKLLDNYGVIAKIVKDEKVKKGKFILNILEIA